MSESRQDFGYTEKGGTVMRTEKEIRAFAADMRTIFERRGNEARPDDYAYIVGTVHALEWMLGVGAQDDQFVEITAQNAARIRNDCQ